MGGCVVGWLGGWMSRLLGGWVGGYVVGWLGRLSGSSTMPSCPEELVQVSG